MLILLLFAISIAGAQYVAVTITTQTPIPTLGTTHPSITPTLGTTIQTPMPTLGTTTQTPVTTIGTTTQTPYQTLGTTPPTGNGIALNPVIGVVAIAGAALVLLHKRK